jgi:hypothetical protein
MPVSSHSVHGNIDEIASLDVETGDQSEATHIPSGSLLMVRGWSTLVEDPGSELGVFAMIDDGPPIEIVGGIERPDVAASMGDDRYALSGFRGIVSTSQLSVGTHRLHVAIRSEDGALLSVGESASFTIVETIEQRLIAAPAEGVSTPMAVDEIKIGYRTSSIPVAATQDDVVHLRGWAIDQAEVAPASAVYAIIGSYVIRATYGELRADIASRYRNERFRDCGFTIEIPLDRLLAGHHTIRLRVVGVGEHVIYEDANIPLDVAAFAALGAASPGGLPARGVVDKMAVFDALGHIVDPPSAMTLVRGHQLFLSGWAIDERNDTLARAVQVCVDGLVSTTAVYGLERRDVAQHFHRPDLTECGFVALVATAALAAGSHHAVVRVIDRSGTRFYDLDEPVEFHVIEE